MRFDEWREVGDRIFVRRHTSFDLNVGLVVGTDACLVIDSRESQRAGMELARAIRTITPAPWAVVNTHAHYDHFLGNAAFAPAPIWALDRCKERIVASGPAQLATFGDGETTLVPPTDTFAPPSHDLDVGGRPVALRHLGRGHTDNDIVVGVDDVIFAGDLVEQGAPPSFDDAYPGEWPATLAALLPLCRGPVVPGHGDVADATFVRDQQAVLGSVAHLSREEAAHSLRGLLG
ncbi:MAG TPA: MBL fold metallo-hydrolase [Jatrophihabitantaceae bacterium]|jgi:glyoxylase-like metal-dependent hydrolase (beta-lactamase superfamily II)|nr:MBL fold metallo-hydrolase [Jatrophihabitantaceae bacterium]